MARCGGPLYVDYNEFPNYGGTSFEGRDYDSRKAPVLGPALWRVHQRVCVMVVSVEHLALCVSENDGCVCACASASYSWRWRESFLVVMVPTGAGRYWAEGPRVILARVMAG